MAVRVRLWHSSFLLSAFCGLIVPCLLPAGTAVAQPEAEPAPTLASVEELAKKVRPSVVVVMFEGREGRQEGLGTGFVIDADGLIATNLHVAGEARPLSVKLADGSRHPVTEVTASDRAMDLAILRIKPPAEPLVPLPLGDSDTLPDGLPVITVGNPHGLTFSVVNGVVSGVREVDDRRMIQLAMPIEPGNSGGPVVDPSGRVVGIVTIKSLVTRNLGFAVGVNALKPLLEKPNPVPMARWLTIGTLDATHWTTLFGSRWQQRGGRIAVTEAGSGFGGRSLCLSRREVPATPFELSVHVKLGDESGAAGLAFHADGANRHYGFYPTAGKLRVTRFDGPSVFEWKVLREMPSPHYRPGDWNQLTVRVENGGFRCLLNGEPFATVDDDSLPAGRVGLAKFRDTDAEFKLFRLGAPADDVRPDDVLARRLEAAIDQLPALERLTPAGMATLADAGEPAATTVRDRATALEKRAADLRLVAADLHTTRVCGELARLCAQGDDCDLLRAALLVAQLDDEELDIDAYMQQVERMAREITMSLPKDADETTRLTKLDTYLFADNGFHGSRTDYYHRANSQLSRVIDDREGLPITLSILYMELANRLDLNVVGIGLPGHFVVQHIPRQGDEQLIDVFEGAVRMTREDAAKRVRAVADVDLDDDHLRPFSKQQIVRRVLRNLLGVAQAAKDREAMLRYLESLVAIEPNDTADRGLLAVARFETGRREAAITGLDWFLEHQPPGIDLDVIRTLQDRFRNGTPPQ